MKQKAARLSRALWMALAVAILLPSFVGASSQDAAAIAPSGAKSQGILDLKPHHMTISVANLALERDWYIEKLGFTLGQMPQMGPGSGRGTPPPPNPKVQFVRLTIPDYRIDLIQFDSSQRAKAPSPLYLAQGWVHIAFSVSNLEKALSFLEAAGTDVKGNRDSNNALMGLLLHDPEGNEIELFSR